jgi:hypothetical protein
MILGVMENSEAEPLRVSFWREETGQSFVLTVIFMAVVSLGIRAANSSRAVS